MFIKMTDRSILIARCQSRHSSDGHERGLPLAAAGIAIGSLTGLLTLNWLCTARPP